MITENNTASISQMRKETEMVLKKADHLPVYLFSRSQIKAVLVNPGEFAKMQEMVENYLDQQELLGISADEMRKGDDWEKAKAQIKK
jgi:PHD/YefM family antitoxin component YafN of YafNO toxin-antitoxin module